MAERSWVVATVLLCGFGFFKAFRPSEAFLTEYLMDPPMNLTAEELNGQVYPVWTYSYLIALVPVFLLTDVLRYKPVIVLEGVCYIGVWSLLLWAQGLQAMCFMQFVYGFATATEIAYFAYPYAVVENHRYQQVTSFTRGFLLTGQFVGSALGQILISLDVCGYYELNIISMMNVCIAFVIALFLPSVRRSDYFHTVGRSDPEAQGDGDSINETIQSSVDSTTGEIGGPISVINPDPEIDRQPETVASEFWEDFNLQDGAGGEISEMQDDEFIDPETLGAGHIHSVDYQAGPDQYQHQRHTSNVSNEFWEDFNLADGTGGIGASDELEIGVGISPVELPSGDIHVEAPAIATIETTTPAPDGVPAVAVIPEDPKPTFNEVQLSDDALREFANSGQLPDDVMTSSNGGIYHTEASCPASSEQTTCCGNTKACCYRNFGPIIKDFKHCYGNRYLLKWSIWWAIATCGNMQVGNYVQILWEHIYPSTDNPDANIYNGAVEAVSTLFGAIVVYLLILVKVNWLLFGELLMGVVSIIDAILLISMALTSNIWVAYAFYILFRVSYQMVITIASFQIASQLNVERYALVFGFNTFIALSLQTLITLIVVDDAVLGVPITTQFIVTGCYFLVMGSVFLGMAIAMLTRIGWYTAWQLRKPNLYREMEN